MMKCADPGSFPPIELKSGYECFFAGLVDMVSGRRIDNGLGGDLRSYVQGFLSCCDLSGFCDFSDDGYRRVHLGRHGASGWEAIMMCWKRGNATTVHGHPQFAAYNFASGHFRIEVFRLNRDGLLEPADTFDAQGGQGFFAVGNDGAYDNHIHRITCLSDTGHSLHVYSDDARKGVVYGI